MVVVGAGGGGGCEVRKCEEEGGRICICRISRLLK
jgi:hypothetical protein